MRHERVSHAPFEIEPLSASSISGTWRAYSKSRFVAGIETRLCLTRIAPWGKQERNSTMTVNRIVLGALALALVAAPAVAQGSKDNNVANPPAAVGNKPATTTGQGAAPVAAKVNLNTATEAELGKLPKMNATHSKAVVDARTKSKFKNWDDFVARKVVPADSAAAIKDSVTF
jgi:DNA uptake protein ComE-like DNA-binding protein